MIVYLTTSTVSLRKNSRHLNLITESISKAGYNIAQDWISAARHRLKNNLKKKPASIANENLELVSKADVIVAEVTYDSFGIGYQVAMAIHLNKPVLLLTKNSKVDKMLQGLADNNMVILKNYSEKTLNAIIEDFLKLNDISSQDLRFNFFIDREIYNSLQSVDQSDLGKLYLYM